MNKTSFALAWQLTGPIPNMLWAGAIIQSIVGNYAGMSILLGIQFINAGFTFYETSKVGNAAAASKALLKQQAIVKRDNKWQHVDASFLVPGDMVKLAAGYAGAVPADLYINEGMIEVDQSSVTGGPPVELEYGDVCKMGSMVTRGETDGTVKSTGQNTSIGQTVAMLLRSVENMGGSLPTSLLGMMKVLVSLSLSLCMISFGFLVVNGNKRSHVLPHIPKKDSAEIVKVSFSRSAFEM